MNDIKYDREDILKRIILLGLIGLMVLATGCSSIRVNYDYDREEDFSRFKTFDFLTPPVDIRVDELVMRRIYSAIALDLKTKNLTRVMDDPDLWVAVHMQVQDRIDVATWGYHYAPYYWYGYWGTGVSAYRYEEGALIIDFVSAKDDELVWRGVGQGALPDRPTSDQIDNLVKYTVGKILHKFPPKK